MKKCVTQGIPEREKKRKKIFKKNNWGFSQIMSKKKIQEAQKMLTIINVKNYTLVYNWKLKKIFPQWKKNLIYRNKDLYSTSQKPWKQEQSEVK